MAISDQLKRAVEGYGSVYRAAKDSGVPQPTLQRFMSGGSGLSMPHMDHLCDFFGMRLTKPTRKRAKRES
jgi:hypothetical protein